MRVREPDLSGEVDRDGVRVHYEVYGEGDPAVLLLMPDTIVEARAWKAQVPFLARRHRVVVTDPRGNGRSDPSPSAAEHTERAMIDDAWAVLRAAGVDRAVVVGLCTGAGFAVLMAAERPDQVLGVVSINPGLGLSPHLPHKLTNDFEAELPDHPGWAKLNRHHWRQDWPDFAGFFMAELLPEPHSTKQWEDAYGWALGTTPEVMLIEHDSPLGDAWDAEAVAAACRRITCPVLVVVGTLDQCQSPDRGRRLAELTGGDLLVIEGGGHLPHARDPVRVNLALEAFLRTCAERS